MSGGLGRASEVWTRGGVQILGHLLLVPNALDIRDKFSALSQVTTSLSKKYLSQMERHVLLAVNMLAENVSRSALLSGCWTWTGSLLGSFKAASPAVASSRPIVSNRRLGPVKSLGKSEAVVSGGTVKGRSVVWRISMAVLVPRRFRRLAVVWSDDNASRMNCGGKKHIWLTSYQRATKSSTMSVSASRLRTSDTRISSTGSIIFACNSGKGWAEAVCELVVRRGHKGEITEPEDADCPTSVVAVEEDAWAESVLMLRLFEWLPWRLAWPTAGTAGLFTAGRGFGALLLLLLRDRACDDDGRDGDCGWVSGAGW